ncbi:hypothetical protein [Burkholderia sp.]|uniref:hypothetical protein n=1 Tax=Burkholderia sp. TaxID=36773 RepID=UPI0025BB11E3|nr:hypothetical protein [Burkholderia sp.]MBS6361488.1 hypothetical protein [Burkholderia sp.]
MSLSAYLPTKHRLAQEIIATTVGVLVAAWIISKWPAAKRLVDGNTVWSTSQSDFSTN